MVNTNKQENFRQLLDVIYEDIILPYNECKLAKWKNGNGGEIIATLSPEELRKAMVDERYSVLVPGYSLQYYPSLSELSEILEAHRLAKESYPTGEITADFSTSLKRLDELKDEEGYFNKSSQYLLFENCGQAWEGKNPLILSRGTGSVWPQLRFIRYTQMVRDPREEKKPLFSIELSVEVNPTRSMKVGKDYLLPSFCQHNPALNVKPRDMLLVGYRVSESSQKDNELDEKWHHFRVYTAEDEIWNVVKAAVSDKMFEAVREVAEDFLGEN
jgi:hypothetical protein